MEYLVKRIKDLIEDSDATQKKLAKLFGITESTFSTYVTGKNRIPAWVVFRLAEYFQVTTDYLYGLTDDPQPPYPVSEAERAMLEAYRTLSKDQKELIVKNISIMQEQNKR